MSTPINDSVVLCRSKRISAQSGAPRTRLRGRRLILALTLASAFLCFTVGAVIFWRLQTGWVIFGICVAGIFVVGLRLPNLLFPVSLWLSPPKRSGEKRTRALPTNDIVGKS